MSVQLPPRQSIIEVADYLDAIEPTTGIMGAAAIRAVSKTLRKRAPESADHIFNADLEYEGPTFQRRLGFWYSYKINPATVKARNIEVERVDEAHVRVHYDAVILPEGADPWSPLLPAGIIDPNPDGGVLTERRTLIALWSEVAR